VAALNLLIPIWSFQIAFYAFVAGVPGLYFMVFIALPHRQRQKQHIPHLLLCPVWSLSPTGIPMPYRAAYVPPSGLRSFRQKKFCMKGAAMKKIFSNYYKIILSVVILIVLVALKEDYKTSFDEMSGVRTVAS